MPDAERAQPSRSRAACRRRRRVSGACRRRRGFPRVDAATQRGRDDVRRKVLGDELAAEERLLAEARAAVRQRRADAAARGAGRTPSKYRERIARLRQAVQLHERNIEALQEGARQHALSVPRRAAAARYC